MAARLSDDQAPSNRIRRLTRSSPEQPRRHQPRIARHHHVDHQEHDPCSHSSLVDDRIVRQAQVREYRDNDPWHDDAERKDRAPRNQPLLPSGRHLNRRAFRCEPEIEAGLDFIAITPLQRRLHPFDKTVADIRLHPRAEALEIGKTENRRVLPAGADRTDHVGAEIAGKRFAGDTNVRKPGFVFLDSIGRDFVNDDARNNALWIDGGRAHRLPVGKGYAIDLAVEHQPAAS